MQSNCNRITVNHCGGIGIPPRAGDQKGLAGCGWRWLFKFIFDAKLVVVDLITDNNSACGPIPYLDL